ncbi:MAG TPA: anti-sigma factor [Acidobacteriaceae bacterium]|nr:anti-sigma factor [Acidobacteriaceae bacterium]
MSAGTPIAFPNSGPPRHPAPEDLTLFAMELFSPEEAAPLARHLDSCAECRAELGRIYSDLALTAASVELESPSTSARQRLLDQVAREKKIIGQPNQQSSTPQTEQRKESKPQPAAETAPPIAAFGRSGSLFAVEDRPQKQTGRTIFAIAGWAAAAGLAFAFLTQHKDRGALNNTLATQAAQLQRLNADAASAHKLIEAITDPQAVRVTLTANPLPKAQPIAGVTYNPSKGSLIFLASNLDPLEAYKTYELWVIPANGTAPIAAGTFHPDEQGNASLIMPTLPKGVPAKGFGITIEAEGGAQTPTPPIIMSGD